jgi:peptide/nickel transport system ATP-binding protein
MYMGRFVETGPTTQIFSRPAHPYTAGLIAAQPHPDPDKRRERAPLLGEVASLAKRPPGCEFHLRCSRMGEICRSDQPTETKFAVDRAYRCHFPLISGNDPPNASAI